MASVATGPVNRVWYSPDGSRLFVRLLSGRVLETADFEKWHTSAALQPAVEGPVPRAARMPESGARLRVSEGPGSRFLYAVGAAAYRSEDGGVSWDNLTQYRNQALLGEGLSDLAVSPADERELVVAGTFGVWRSLDGGLSWTGLNQNLPNLPVRRLLRLPRQGGGTRVLLRGVGAVTELEAEWAPGQKSGWAPVTASESSQEKAVLRSLTESVGDEVLAFAAAGDYVYAGGREGRLWSSSDQGRTWRASRFASAGDVERLSADRREPRLALAAFAADAGELRRTRVARTMNAGIFWDDLTANLPPGAAHGVVAERESGAVYAATDAGVFVTYVDLLSAGPPSRWTSLSAGLPEAPANDVRLDEEGNQLFVALEGYGVFAATAPHRFRSPRVVNAADFAARAAAPGALLSVLGSRVATARAGSVEVPVLAAGDSESQIQVPFEIVGTSLALALRGASPAQAILNFSLPMLAASPAIFIDRDGTPMVLDADRGILLDAMAPARSGSRIQILATGLGKVTPDWPTGLAAPLEDTPRVVAPVRVFLDQAPVEVTRATLAPGYVGFYVIEIQIPGVVNSGPAELYVEAAGQASNRVRIYLEP